MPSIGKRELLGVSVAALIGVTYVARHDTTSRRAIDRIDREVGSIVIADPHISREDIYTIIYDDTGMNDIECDSLYHKINRLEELMRRRKEYSDNIILKF